jgi:putative peptidoglycan lipid II flippase
MVVPSAVAFLTLGDVIAAALLQTGRFGPADAVYVWGILAGAAIGLLPSTMGRLYSSAYVALRDTRTPLRYATLRVLLGTAMAYLFAIALPRSIGIPPVWGAAGLTLAAGVAGWVEMLLLRRVLTTQLGSIGLGLRYAVSLWIAATGGAAAAWGVKLMLPPLHPALGAAGVLGTFGAVFLGSTLALGIPEASTVFARITRRI